MSGPLSWLGIFHLRVHQMVAPKKIVTNWQNIMEGAGEKELCDNSCERNDDYLMISFYS
jgi:hypothetical protein